MKELLATDAVNNMSGIKPAFVIVERDLKGRCRDVESLCGSKVHVIDFQTISGLNIFSTLIKRYRHAKSLLGQLDKIATSIIDEDIIFLSNTEGYIAKNLVERIRSLNSNVVIVSLQHGMFMIERNIYRRSVRAFLSKLTKTISGVHLIGDGIYNKNVNCYVVYNEKYKQEIVLSGCDAKNVFVSTETLKGIDFWSKQTVQNGNEDAIIFLLQPLSALGLMTQSDEMLLINSLISELTKSYNKIYIKQHPYKTIEGIDVSEKCEFVSASITELASAAGNAISFFSEALHELEYLGLNTFAVYDARINTSIDNYKQFQCTVTLKNGLIVKKRERACQNKYYQSEISLSDLNGVLCKQL